MAGLVAPVPSLFLAGRSVPGGGWWWLTLPVALALLASPMLNRLLAWLMGLARREPLEHPMTGGIAVAAGSALLGWVVVGVQVWLLGLGLGLDRSASSLLRVVGAYAVAWIVG